MKRSGKFKRERAMEFGERKMGDNGDWESRFVKGADGAVVA